MPLIAIRSYDGSQVELDRRHLISMYTLADLRQTVSDVLDIAPENIILMHADGWQIDDRVLPTLLDESRKRNTQVYAFNRDFLDADIDELQIHLIPADEPLLQQPALPALGKGQTSNYLAGEHLANARDYHDVSISLLEAIKQQRASLGVALRNLRRHYDGKKGAMEAFEVFASPLLEELQDLLESHDVCMDVVSHIRVHPAIITSTSSTHFLVDYLGKDTLESVKESCARSHADLQSRFGALRSLLSAVAKKCNELEEEYSADGVEDLHQAAEDAEGAFVRTGTLVQEIRNTRGLEQISTTFEELTACEADTRERLRYLVARRQNSMRLLLTTMQSIASLQSTLYDAPTLIGKLDEDLRSASTNGFKHLSKLRTLVPAYVATLVEIVRRKRFDMLLEERSHVLAGALSALSVSESQRRMEYRSETTGKLLWEIQGLEKPAPIAHVEIRRPHAGSTGSAVAIQKADIEHLVENLAELAIYDQSKPMREIQCALQLALTRLEALEADFEHSDSSSKSQGQKQSEPNRQLQDLRAQFAALEGELQAERDVARLREAEMMGFKVDLSHQRRRAESLADELENVKKESARKLEAEQEDATRSQAHHEALKTEMKTLKRLLATREEQMSKASQCNVELTARLDAHERQHEEANKRTSDASQTISTLREELERITRQAGEMEDALASARTEIKSERERADSVERLLASLQPQAESMIIELRAHKTKTVDLERQRAVALDQAAEAQAALRDANRSRDVSRVEAQAYQAQKEAALVQARRALKLTKALHDFNEATADSLTMTGVVAGSEPSLNVLVTGPSNSARPTSPDWNALDAKGLEEQRKMYENGPGDASERLSMAIAEKVKSLNATTRKWQKECKVYRDRAKAAASLSGEKIAFRHFVTGDLALFLPTRNSTAQIWAAFNFGFPHYFLSPSGVIAELIQSREYVIARLLSIVERTVDPKDTSTNPFSLPSGTKYFLLEAEPWYPAPRHRKSSSQAKAKMHANAVQATYPLEVRDRRPISCSTLDSPSQPVLPDCATSGQSEMQIVSEVLDTSSIAPVFEASRLASKSSMAPPMPRQTPPVTLPENAKIPIRVPDSSVSPYSASPAFLPVHRPRVGNTNSSTDPSRAREDLGLGVGKAFMSVGLAAARRSSLYSASPPSKAPSTTSTSFTLASAGSDENAIVNSSDGISASMSQMQASNILKQFGHAVHDITSISTKKKGL